MKEELLDKELLRPDRYLKWLALGCTTRKYGDHDFFMERLEHELELIAKLKLSNHFILLKRLKDVSYRKGYPIILFGNGESLLVTNLLRISHVNPLKSHYHCRTCHYTEFNSKVEDGYDLTEKRCPICNDVLQRDGHDLCGDVFWEKPNFRIGVAPSAMPFVQERFDFLKKKMRIPDNWYPIQLEESMLCETIGRMKKETGIHFGNVNPRDKDAGIYVYDEEHQRIFGDIDVDLDKYCFRELVRVGQTDSEQNIDTLMSKITLEWYKQHFPDVYIRVMEELDNLAFN